MRNSIRGQEGEAVLSTASKTAAKKWTDAVWWRTGQPWMKHEAELKHIIRKEGPGDREAWRGGVSRS